MPCKSSRREVGGPIRQYQADANTRLRQHLPIMPGEQGAAKTAGGDYDAGMDFRGLVRLVQLQLPGHRPSTRSRRLVSATRSAPASMAA